MSKSKGYTSESLAHALAHHESRGILRTVSPPYVGSPRWRVTFADGAALDMTPGEAYAVCVALANAEAHARAEHERMVRDLSQRDGPICLDDELEHEVALLRGIVRSLSMRSDAVVLTLDSAQAAACQRALDELDRPPRKCGVHGDDTTSGRCFSCDVDLLREQLRLLDAATKFEDAERPYERVVALCERQPRLVPVVLAWTHTEPSEATS